MTSVNLEKLVDTGQLKKEPGDQAEFDGLVYSGRTRLNDARQDTLSLEGRFDLAYNAAHALSLAALRAGGRLSFKQPLPGVSVSAAHPWCGT